MAKNINQALKERRFGTVFIERKLITDCPNQVLSFFLRSKALILEAKYSFDSDANEYLLLHQNFEPVPEGQKAPIYSLAISQVKNEDGTYEEEIIGWNK